MVKKLSCPQKKCSWWGVPLERDDPRTLTQVIQEDGFQCCAPRDVGMKCRRDPRFQDDPEAQDYFEAR